ncbi:DUF4949 domain-containing protein [Legionella tunisiensis]|uniref:DUF4949 domain-containing protein n=1 Tax=Legionella tunisiensis TaxID=1034944 RepID=UPI000369D1B6|nr:DUF4949 domain-containing protein [Legionella tunisiensis]
MTLKSLFSAFVSALVISGSSFAFENPSRCPDANLIKSTKMALAQALLRDTYLTYNLSKYGTPNSWLFTMGPIPAESAEKAVDEGNKLLVNLSGNPIPQKDQEEIWACVYNMRDDHTFAVAFQSDSMLSPLKVKQFFNTKH